MEEHKQSSSSTFRHLRYDIFLSFRGEDTRDTFTAYLYRELRQKQYDVFRDEEGIQCGDKIAPTLEKAIRESRLSIVVLSKDYASSTSCLNELETIMECYREGWHHVVPVFYHVDPHQVRHQQARFAVSFHQHEKDEKKNNKVGPWKAALRDIADLKGIHVEKGKRKEPDIIHETIQVIGEIIGNGLKRTENPIPTSDLVGKGFEIAKAKILSWLNKDEVIKIGVYGMGGVGKTSLMTNVYNQVRESFTMRWITVSQDFSINKLQNLIAASVELDVSKEKDVKTRAAKLYVELSKKQDLVLILDDLWNSFDENEVGIPLWPKGCKLIFTTRARDICDRMNCQEYIIKMDPLDMEEAWLLFRKEIVNYNQNVEEVAKLIASECAGLPLAIRTMARYMRGVHDPCEWRNTLVELRESQVRNNDMEPDVFRILRFSYDRLQDSSLQQCFLYCSLFPEDFKIPRKHLIKLLIAEGIIDPKSYIRDQVNKGHTMLNKLENLCLLEKCYVNDYGDVDKDKKCVKMHDLIRDMALQILRKGSPVMVKAGMRLEELPDVDEWEEEDLVTVSLMRNNIREINSGQSPMCPKLSTLLLCYNPRSRSIGDSLFQQFCHLKVLDLSQTFIQILPSSISNLVRLTALLLRKCQRLKHVPSLAKLQELKMLDLSYACIEQVPDGMELLLKLRHIDMYGCSKIKVFPFGILPNLSHLQFFRLYRYTVVKGEEVGGLRRLQYLECGFQDLNNYMQSQNHLELDSFIITVLPQDIPASCVRHFPRPKSPNMFILYSCDIGRELKLPKGTVKLTAHGCKCQRSLFPLQNTNGLRCIEIIHCHEFECLVSTSSGSCVHLLTGLERLTLKDNPSLQVLIRIEEDEVPAVLPLSYANVFAHLKNITVYGCHGMKKLFPRGLLSNLQNLQTISVDNCYRMEEIIASEEREETCSESNNKRLKSESSLPRLTSLQLRMLPLKNICSSLLICESLEEIVVSGCLMLTRIPIAPPLPSFRKMEILSYEQDWWKQLEWDYPDVKTVLSSCLSITKKEKMLCPYEKFCRSQSAAVWEDASGSETESSESASSKLYAI